MQINDQQLQKIVDEALDKCGTNRRWINAVRRAERELLENPYIHFDGQTLLILSPSLHLYETQQQCQCKAFAMHQPCWHRAAHRLVELALAS